MSGFDGSPLQRCTWLVSINSLVEYILIIKYVWIVSLLVLNECLYFTTATWIFLVGDRQLSTDNGNYKKTKIKETGKGTKGTRPPQAVVNRIGTMWRDRRGY